MSILDSWDPKYGPAKRLQTMKKHSIGFYSIGVQQLIMVKSAIYSIIRGLVLGHAYNVMEERSYREYMLLQKNWGKKRNQ